MLSGLFPRTWECRPGPFSCRLAPPPTAMVAHQPDAQPPDRASLAVLLSRSIPKAKPRGLPWCSTCGHACPGRSGPGEQRRDLSRLPRHPIDTTHGLSNLLPILVESMGCQESPVDALIFDKLPLLP